MGPLGPTENGSFGANAPSTHSPSLIVSAFLFVKDRQQEAERDLQYLTLFSSYCMHINILYKKWKLIFVSIWLYTLIDMISLVY